MEFHKWSGPYKLMKMFNYTFIIKDWPYSLNLTQDTII